MTTFPDTVHRFFSDLYKDIKQLPPSPSPRESDEQKQVYWTKVESIVYRSLGATLAVVSGVFLLAGLVTVATAPFSFLVLLTISAAAAVLARDCIVYGVALRDIGATLATITDPLGAVSENGVLGTLGALCSTVGRAVGSAIEGENPETAPARDTWVLKHLFSLCS